MEIVFIVIGVLLFIFILAGSKLLKRKKIVRKAFNELAASIESGKKDRELLENREKEVESYNAAGMAIVFGNQVKGKILEEFKQKGLANAKEKNSVWTSGDHTLDVVSHEINKLENIIVRRYEVIEK